MAIDNFIDRVQIGSDDTHQIAIGSSAYATCTTSASTAGKIINIPGFTLNTGTTIHVKFSNNNTAADPTLAIEYGTGASDITAVKPIIEYDGTAVRTSGNHLGWEAGAILTLTYDGTSWIINNGYNVIVDKVKHNAKTDNVNYKVLLSAGGATLTDGNSYEAAYNTGLYFNPNSKTLTIDNGTNSGTLTPTEYSGNAATASSVEWAGVQNKPSLATSNHVHGNIENNGTLQESDIEIASGDKLVITDASDNHLIARAITNNAQNEVRTFDGSTTTRALTQKGSFENIVNSIGGYSGVVTLADLGLANAIHFLGITTTNLFDYPTTNPITIGGNNYIPSAGDVVLCNKIENNIITDQREFIWTGNNGWQLLGFSASNIYDSNDGVTPSIITTTASDPNNPTWISRIQQATDGKITVERQTIGILPVVHGGTGVNAINNENCVIVAITATTGGPQTLISRALKIIEDNSSNLTITNNVSNAAITINASGTGNITISSNYGSLALQGIANSNTQSILTLGNHIASNNGYSSEGKIILYSSNTNAHTIIGKDTTTDYTHTLPNHTGWIVSGGSPTGAGAGVAGDTQLMYLATTGILTASLANVGSSTRPVYLEDGIIKPLTFVPNRLYYSEAIPQGETSSISFTATGHYASTSAINIGSTSAPASGYIFEVNGKTNLLDNLNLNGNGNITGIVTITNTTDITTGSGATDGALIVSGGVTIAKKVHIGNNLTVDERVGIGGDPDSTASTSTDWHILKIYGSTLIADTSGVTSAHIDILTETVNSASTYAVKFYPASNKHGYIGLDTARWEKGYFSNLIEISDTGYISLQSAGYIQITNAISNATSTIELDTQTSSGTTKNQIKLTGPIPTIIFDTTTSDASTWIMTNTAGAFSLNNSGTGASLRELLGTNNGFKLTNRLSINADISNDYILYIGGGDTFSDGNIIPSLDENNEPEKTLGSTSNRWAAVYIGDGATHGDEYTPVYWDNGVPYQVPVVQKYAFSFSQGESSKNITISNTYAIFAVVNSIVVDTGISYLREPLSWSVVTSSNTTTIQISTTTAVGGTVSGYILVSTGLEPNVNQNLVIPSNT